MARSGYQLSAQIIGHQSDVRGVAFIKPDLIASVSRDTTAQLWTRESKGWTPKTFHFSDKYLNSVTFDDSSAMIYVGAQNGVVTGHELGSSESETCFLIGHESNVCAIHCCHGQVMTGSWDKTARLWVDGECKYVLKAHSQAVWAVLILSETMFASASADLTIRIWQNDQNTRTLTGHTEAVRALCRLDDDIIASCSNDSTIRVWDYKSGNQLRVLQGHTSFVYSLSKLDDARIVSSGEDRSIRVWDWRHGSQLQVITLPAISIWSTSVDSSTGDIVAGSSDSYIRVFTEHPDRVASKDELKALEEALATSALGKDQIQEAVNKEKLPGPERLLTPGSKVGQVVMIKDEMSINALAYQWAGKEWTKIGEVVGSDGSSNSKSTTFDDKQYDYVFDVDIADDRPALKLPYNLTENPYDAARKFIEQNNLPTVYTEQVVQFIISNTKSVNITSTKPSTDLQNESTTRPNRILPVRDFVCLASHSPETIIKAMRDANDSLTPDLRVTAEEMTQVERGLRQMDSNSAQFLFNLTSRLISRWPAPSLLPVLDILRIAVPKLTETLPSEIVLSLFSCLDVDLPKHSLLATRGLVNMFSVPGGLQTLLSEQVRNHTIQTLESVLQKLISDGAQIVNHCVAATSLLINYSVAEVQKTVPSPQVIQTLIDSAEKIAPLVTGPEPTYRMLIAGGTLLTTKAGSANSRKSLTKLLTDKASLYKEKRMNDLVQEILSIR